MGIPQKDSEQKGNGERLRDMRSERKDAGHREMEDWFTRNFVEFLRFVGQAKNAYS